MKLTFHQETQKSRQAWLAAWWLALLLLGLSLPTARGQEAAPESLESRLVKVVAPQATAMVVHEEFNLLIVAQHGEAPLQVYKLDEQGLIAGEPRTAALPRPDSLAGFKHYPLGLALHPKLPLLYVWQDITVPDSQVAAQRDIVFNSFDHLILFSVAQDGTLAQVGAYARGPEFRFGELIGSMGLDPQAQRIYLPNMGDRVKERLAIGYYDLTAQGHPAPTPAPIAGSLDGFGLEKYEMVIQPTSVDITANRDTSPGYGLVSGQQKVCIYVIHQGIAVWDTENRRAWLATMPLLHGAAAHRIAAFPGIPAVFGAGYGGTQVFRIMLARGYPTMMPQRMTYGGRQFYSTPALLPGSPAKLVIGAENSVHGITLDAEGRLTAAIEKVVVNQPAVSALAVSAQHRRVYVPVAAAEAP